MKSSIISSVMLIKKLPVSVIFILLFSFSHLSRHEPPQTWIWRGRYVLRRVLFKEKLPCLTRKNLSTVSLNEYWFIFMLFVEKNMAKAWGERTARNCVYFLKTQTSHIYKLWRSNPTFYVNASFMIDFVRKSTQNIWFRRLS